MRVSAYIFSFASLIQYICRKTMSFNISFARSVISTCHVFLLYIVHWANNSTSDNSHLFSTQSSKTVTPVAGPLGIHAYHISLHCVVCLQGGWGSSVLESGECLRLAGKPPASSALRQQAPRDLSGGKTADQSLYPQYSVVSDLD